MTCPSDFDAVVTVVRAWRNGAVDVELRASGGANDGMSGVVRLDQGEASSLLAELARILARVRT